MMLKFRFMLFLGSLLIAASTYAQEKVVSMYLEPDLNGTVYFQETMTELEDLEPRPLLDGQGAGQGWMFVQYPGRYVGYISASEVGPNKQVNNGAKAFLRPDTNSPVLAVILDGKEAEVARVENGWATVYFVGEAPAYFHLSEAAPSSSSVVAPPAIVGVAPTPVSTPAPVSGTPVLDEVVMQEAVIPTTSPTALKPPGQDVSRYLQGTFERVTTWDRLFGSDYKYRLVDEEGDTIAYVIVDDSLFFGPVESYWGENVEVKGVMRRITGTVPLEINAGNIRVLH